MDNLTTRLDSYQALQQLLMKNLPNERIVTISTHITLQEACKKAVVTKVITITELHQKYQKDIFTDKKIFKIYSRIAEIIKKTINELKYHLK